MRPTIIVSELSNVGQHAVHFGNGNALFQMLFHLEVFLVFRSARRFANVSKDMWRIG